MNTTRPQDLRRFSRVPFDAPVQLQLHGKTISVQLVDIALKGALVQTDTAPERVLHEECRLLLPLAEGGEGLAMSGRIVHLEPHRVGIECQNIDLTSLTRLRRLIELNTGDTALADRELSQLFV